jgi:hypothetical protein
MSRIYDIFELLPDGSKLLRGCAAGLDGAKVKFQQNRRYLRYRLRHSKEPDSATDC